ncbi:Arsenical pump membrane protein [Rutstroemia sp. NJR-2017a BVV2]|nr:Arsenical pump membrane protein [Rutstroemia sp. NJR-2017a BVV2]
MAYLAFKVLQKGGKVGHRLFFFLYVFFFALGTFIGNDPIILSGTAFLAYMTRVSSNIIHPRAWIHTQFAIANIASAILVSSNPTNLVLSGAFGIKFIVYTANMIVPVVVTAIVLFPFLLYIVFADESLIPYSIKMHELSEEAKAKKPVNPNIPNARGNAQEEEKKLAEDKLLSLEEIMNPFLDKGGAAFGAVIMAATLVTLLAINAASQSEGEHPVYWVTLPAAFVMFCWEVGFGWFRRHETREIARKGRREIELSRERREEEMREMNAQSGLKETGAGTSRGRVEGHGGIGADDDSNSGFDSNNLTTIPTIVVAGEDDRSITISTPKSEPYQAKSSASINEKQETTSAERATSSEVDERAPPSHSPHDTAPPHEDNRATLVSLLADAYRWCQETFPTVTAVVAHLPFALVPFAFSMFVLVQALVTKGWVPVFAYGWDHWVAKTGTVGAIGGMGFLSVILCNFAGTNIGTTILLCRVIQAWRSIHEQSQIPITNRTFWATVYSMAIGVNYGAFSTAFSASLAGLLWRDILARKYIYVRRLDFARVNLPIIAIAMAVGCAVLVGQVYIVRGDEPYVWEKI